MGRDDVTDAYGLTRQISIHAPAWGATDRISREYPGDAISIHAPAWGATVESVLLPVKLKISIHAPAWGATAAAAVLAG